MPNRMKFDPMSREMVGLWTREMMMLVQCGISSQQMHIPSVVHINPGYHFDAVEEPLNLFALLLPQAGMFSLEIPLLDAITASPVSAVQESLRKAPSCREDMFEKCADVKLLHRNIAGDLSA